LHGYYLDAYKSIILVYNQPPSDPGLLSYFWGR